MSNPNYTTLTPKSNLYISKYRYRELRYFCLQYKEFKQKLSAIDLKSRSIIFTTNDVRTNDVVSKMAEKREGLLKNIRLIEQTAIDTDEVLANYILEGVTTEKDYNKINAKTQIPTNRRYYYLIRRRFFWILDKRR